jgi:hypothetical protein
MNILLLISVCASKLSFTSSLLKRQVAVNEARPLYVVLCRYVLTHQDPAFEWKHRGTIESQISDSRPISWPDFDDPILNDEDP